MCAFTNFDENNFSQDLFFCVRKIKLLEAIERKDYKKPVEIYKNEIKSFSTKPELEELGRLIYGERVCDYDTEASTVQLCIELEDLLKTNPSFNGKLKHPSLDDKTLTVVKKR
ncbi:hypothetical protein TorRG33x02_141130 [Trema orientale]|uniref:TPR1-like CTLH-containing domain-containing protein n=1 Tax=Trema orientale TaxID=63057 RepID=A0A2P5EX20_TREOI|nr:hypothetical protein TorRG33x02_141130 [Trema orientale]